MLQERLSFSRHALEQFAYRTYTDVLQSYNNMSHIFSFATSISRQEAFELNGDKNILKKENRKALYFKVDLSAFPFQDIFGDRMDLLEGIIGIFVIKDNEVVTFKTNADGDIYNSIQRYCNSKRVVKVV